MTRDRRLGAVRNGRVRCAGPVLLAITLLLTVSSCGSPAVSHPGDPKVKVTEKDFRLVVQPTRVAAGWVTVQVSNRGPDAHEVIIVRTTGADGRLPLRRDGITVDEDAVEARTVQTVELVQSGTMRTVRVRLAAGRYEFMCNMAGHYLAGMHSSLTVAAPS